MLEQTQVTVAQDFTVQYMDSYKVSFTYCPIPLHPAQTAL